MRSAIACCAVLGVAIAILGCKGDKTEPAPTVPPSAIGSATSEEDRHEGRPEPYANENLPDEADFADEAEKEITAGNYGAKLGEIEKEIAAAESALVPAAPVAAPTAAAATPSAGASAAGTAAAATAGATAATKDRAAGTGSAKAAPPSKTESTDEETTE